MVTHTREKRCAPSRRIKAGRLLILMSCLRRSQYLVIPPEAQPYVRPLDRRHAATSRGVVKRFAVSLFAFASFPILASINLKSQSAESISVAQFLSCPPIPGPIPPGNIGSTAIGPATCTLVSCPRPTRFFRPCPKRNNRLSIPKNEEFFLTVQFAYHYDMAESQMRLYVISSARRQDVAALRKDDAMASQSTGRHRSSAEKPPTVPTAPVSASSVGLSNAPQQHHRGS